MLPGARCVLAHWPIATRLKPETGVSLTRRGWPSSLREAAATGLVRAVMKELPATLVMRPFNFDTLATRAFQLASDEQVARSALPALLIVAVGTVPVILLSRIIARQRV